MSFTLKSQRERNGLVARQEAFKTALRATAGEVKVRELFQLMTAGEAAEFLALELGTVRNLTYRRELPSVKIGARGVRYRLIDLIAWSEQRSRLAI
jgi:excisionase family DNA binding protein